jgi:hypothetical protein
MRASKVSSRKAKVASVLPAIGHEANATEDEKHQTDNDASVHIS